jgi:tRNA (adenine37-N6)-methyltransferase
LSTNGSERVDADPATPKAVVFRPIGVIRSEHRLGENTPVQPSYAVGIPGTVEVFPEYVDGLDDLESFSHIYLIYHLHRSKGFKPKVIPFMQDEKRGVFATRSPSRPNAIGISLVRLVGREGNLLHVEDVDILDGSPLLDIKPYIFRFDSREDARSRWQDEVDEATARERGRRGYSGREGE